MNTHMRQSYCWKQEFMYPVLPPAVAEGKCLLRTSYTATQEDALIEEAAQIICGVFKYMHENPLPEDFVVDY